MAKTEQRLRRRKRIRAKISGTSRRPRISVFKSNKYLSAQLIDDDKGTTLGAVTSKGMTKGGAREKAHEVGVNIAKIAKGKKITEVVFDRGGYSYAGRIKALAEGAREGGLKF